MKYVKYLRYVLVHKWFVFLECVKLGIPFRGLIHDISKFYPSEFLPYAEYFYGDNKNEKARRDKTGYHHVPEEAEDNFNFAWLLHQKRNRHHWQWWILIRDNDDNKGEFKIFDMPLKYRKEMLADWRGAGRAQGFGDNTKKWYIANGNKMRLHQNTQKWLEEGILK